MALSSPQTPNSWHELDDALGLTETATACLQESRGGRNVQHQLVPDAGWFCELDGKVDGIRE